MSVIPPLPPSHPKFTLQAGDIVRLNNGGSAIIQSTDVDHNGVLLAYGKVGARLVEWNASNGGVSSGGKTSGDWGIKHVFGGVGRDGPDMSRYGFDHK